MGLPWEISEQSSAMVGLNRRGVDVSSDSVPPAIKMNAYHLRYVHEQESWYWQVPFHRGVDKRTTPLVMAKVGKGRIGFIGGFREQQLVYSGGNENIDDYVIDMCGVGRKAAGASYR
jgi:hypothetical protein